MKIESLSDLQSLPMASSTSDVDERVVALLKLSGDNPKLSSLEIADALVDVISDVCYMESMSEKIEDVVLQWISGTFDESSEEYMDAIATIYANMSSLAAKEDIDQKFALVSNVIAKKYLSEAKGEFVLKT